MAERSSAWAAKVIELLNRHGSNGKPMSPYSAANRTAKVMDGEEKKIVHQTIRNWTNGDVPTLEYLRWFVDSFNEPRTPYIEATNRIPSEADTEWDRKRFPHLFTEKPGERPENRDSSSSRKETLEGGTTERNIIPVRLIASGPRGENLERAPRRFDLLVMAAHWLPLIEGERYPSFRWDAARVRPGNVILSKDGEEYRATVYSLDTDTGEFSEETTFVVIDQPLPQEE